MKNYYLCIGIIKSIKTIIKKIIEKNYHILAYIQNYIYLCSVRLKNKYKHLNNLDYENYLSIKLAQK